MYLIVKNNSRYIDYYLYHKYVSLGCGNDLGFDSLGLFLVVNKSKKLKLRSD